MTTPTYHDPKLQKKAAKGKSADIEADIAKAAGGFRSNVTAGDDKTVPAKVTITDGMLRIDQMAKLGSKFSRTIPLAKIDSVDLEGGMMSQKLRIRFGHDVYTLTISPEQGEWVRRQVDAAKASESP